MSLPAITWSCMILSCLLAVDSKKPKDDDTVVWIANGSQASEKFVGLLNTGKKGQAHKMEVRFDSLGLPSGHGIEYSLHSITLNREVEHPKDSFGCNLLPLQEEVFQVTRRQPTPRQAEIPELQKEVETAPLAGGNYSLAVISQLQTEWYDNTSGLWDRQPGAALWWESANSLELLCNYLLSNQGSHSALVAVLSNTYDKTSLHETLTGRYDDEGWWALAWMRSYEVQPDMRFLERAEAIFQDLAANAWDDWCGGGVWWSYAKAYKNAITNELFFAMAAKLHHLTHGGSCMGLSYLDWAQKTWLWFDHSGMINDNNLINDGLNQPGVDPACGNNGNTEWTYNQGVVLGGLAWLYEATANESLLSRGIAIANATIHTLIWSKKQPILKESCEFSDGSNDCDNDQQQFKGVFVRHLMYFCEVLPAKFAAERHLFQSWIDSNFESIWNSDRRLSDLGLTWVGPFSTSSAAVQTSAADVVLAHEILQAPKSSQGTLLV